MTNNAIGTRLNAVEFIFGVMQEKRDEKDWSLSPATQKLQCREAPGIAGTAATGHTTVDKLGIDRAITTPNTATGEAGMTATTATAIISRAIVVCARGAISGLVLPYT